MGSITSYRKQIVVFFIVLSLFIRPSFASTVGGWSMGNPIAQGASTIYEGSKNVIINGADYVKKGTAKITPTAANVAKTLGKGVAGVAVSVVIDELLDGVDWVLDPENNRIKYYEEGSWIYSNVYDLDAKNVIKGPSVVDVCSRSIAYFESKNGYGYSYHSATAEPLTCRLKTSSGSVSNFAIYKSEVVQDEEKYLPLDVVASQVISNAESGDTNAQVITSAAAADIVAEAETDNVKARPIAQQLEATSTKPADQAIADKAAEAIGTAKPNEANPQATDISLKFPAFCGWAPTVCEFAQTAIQSMADAKAEYADKPQENTDTELEIPDLEQDIEVDTDISFGGSCPAHLTSEINFMGINETIEFSFDPVCEIAEFIKPVVISVSAFSAALIVAGIRTEDD